MPIKKKKPEAVVAPMEFTPVSQIEPVLAVLVYGRSGTGKTTFASTFPGPSLILDIRERGTDSVANVKNMKAAKITSWDQIESIYWYLMNGKHEFKTVIIDQISSMQDLALSKAMKDNGKKETDQVAKRDFGHASGLMKTWLMNYRDLIDQGIHVVFLAHDRLTKGGEDADEGSGEDQIEPVMGARLMPSVASLLNGAVKIIGNTFIRETFSIVNKRKKRSVQYSMRIGPHAYFTTKTRSPVGVVSPDVIVDPTYEKLLQVLTGDYQEEEDDTPVKSGVRKKK